VTEKTAGPAVSALTLRTAIAATMRRRDPTDMARLLDCGVEDLERGINLAMLALRDEDLPTLTGVMGLRPDGSDPEEEVAALRKANDDLDNVAKGVIADLTTVRFELVAAKAALRLFSEFIDTFTHDDDCPGEEPGAQCVCGLSETQEVLRVALR